MKYITAFLMLWPAVFAIPLLQADSAKTLPLQIVLQVDKVTANTAVEVWNSDRSQILDRSCSSVLNNTSLLDTPVVFAVDNQGAGTLRIGSKDYTIHDDPARSGGIKCNRMHSQDEFIVSCEAAFSVAQQNNIIATRDLPKCFTQGPTKLYGILRGMQRNSARSARNMYSSVDSPRVPSKRQGSCGSWSQATQLVGNGNPHQNPKNIQLSVPMDCQQGTCSIGHSEVKSLTVSWSASATAYGWTSGGFAVEQSVETGNTYECSGEAGQYFAVWKAQGQTAYTVQNYDINQCTGSQASGNAYIMWSPNSGDHGSSFYCVYGHEFVRNVGDSWTDTSDAHPGGPP